MSILDQYREQLKHHELHKVSENEYIMYCGNFMREKQVNIGFVDQGGRVVITGDWHPGEEGVVSIHGYGKEWFKRKMDPVYMVSKFNLQSVLHPEYKTELLEHCLGLIGEDEKEIEEHVRDEFEKVSFDDIYNFRSDWDYLLSDGVIASLLDSEDAGIMFGYEESDYEMLVAIQERFSELYAKMEMDREEWRFDG